MRRVEPVIDAWFDSGSMPSAQWGYPGAPGLRGPVRLPGRLHLRGHRPDPGLVLLAARRQHPGARRHPLPQRALPRPHRGRRRPQDVQERRERHRPVGDPLDPGGRSAALVDVLPGVPVDADPGQLRRHRRLHAGHPADPVEHLVVLHHLRLAQRVRPGRPGHPRSGRPFGPRPLDAVPPGRHRGRSPPSPSTATSRSRRPRPSPSWSTTSPTGTSGAAGAGSGAPTPTPTRPTRWAPRPPCTRCW